MSILGIKKAINAIENVPDDFRENVVALLDGLDEAGTLGDLGEDLGAGLIRGAMKALREELQIKEPVP